MTMMKKLLVAVHGRTHWTLQTEATRGPANVWAFLPPGLGGSSLLLASKRLHLDGRYPGRSLLLAHLVHYQLIYSMRFLQCSCPATHTGTANTYLLCRATWELTGFSTAGMQNAITISSMTLFLLCVTPARPRPVDVTVHVEFLPWVA